MISDQRPTRVHTYQNHIFDRLMEAGKDLGLKPYGIRAMNSLRLEKSYKLVGTELSIEYSPYESGLDRFVHPNKGNFIGLDAFVIEGVIPF